MNATRSAIARLPVLGWESWRGKRQAPIPCFLDLPGLIYTRSGRAAILQGLKFLGLQAGDRVLVPSYHTPTMVAPVVHLKGVPVFYPLDAGGAPILAWIKAQDLTGVRVLMVAHLFGLPQPMAEIRRWCDDQGVALLEDCAHAMFGRSDGRALGSWGDVAIASLSKFLPMHEGGCLLTSGRVASPALKSSGFGARLLWGAMESAASQGRLHGLNALIAAAAFAWDVLGGRQSSDSTCALGVHGGDGRPSLAVLGGVQEEQAQQALPAVGRWLAKRLPRARIVLRRRQNFSHLASLLAGFEAVRPLTRHLSPDCAPYVFPLWVAKPDPGYASLRALGVPISRWNWPWPGVPEIDGDCGRDWSGHLLQLACHQDLSDADVERMAKTLLGVFNARPSDQSTFDLGRQGA